VQGTGRARRNKETLGKEENDAKNKGYESLELSEVEEPRA
jgi:hypothetical protein